LTPTPRAKPLTQHLSSRPADDSATKDDNTKVPNGGVPTPTTTSDKDIPPVREPQPRHVASAAKEILGRAEGRSGATTPTFAKTAAEVADSAALVNKEDPEPRMSDDEAGRIGYRRLTSTPIAEVARTAAEVADTAKELDSDDKEVRAATHSRDH